LVRHPPTSTTFPYTTLFRSQLEEVLAGSVTVSAGVVEGGGSGHLGEASHDVVPEQRAQRLRTMPGTRDRQHPRADDESLQHQSRDRKSTRLNSSHRTISYAV